jgi:hypothetical protein
MSRGITIRLSAAALALITAAVMITPSGARGYREVSTVIAPGVVHTKIRDPKGPWKIHVIAIELDQASTIEPALATRKLPGAETTSAIAQRYGALAAINGDYMRESGRPVMLFAQDGELGQTALARGVNFAVDESESAAFIKRQVPRIWFRDSDGSEHAVNSYNAGWPGADMIAAFSALGGRDEKPPYGACSARLYPTEGPRPASTTTGVGQTHVVHEVACKDGRMFPKQGRVLSTPLAGFRSSEINPGLAPGEQVELGWSLEWPGVTETIGGNPTLVRDGEIFIGRGETSFFNRHPRTGVGYTADGKVLFVTVDGRQAGYSVGMTPLRFAKLFRSLGATYALNLDGGGSTTMVVNGDVINRPSGGSQRLVSSALLLLPGPDPAPTASPAPVPSSSPTTEPTPSPTELVPDIGPDVTQTQSEVWLDVVTDPASTGGLADWLRSRGIRLHGSLREAAWLFSRLR